MENVKMIARRLPAPNAAHYRLYTSMVDVDTYQHVFQGIGLVGTITGSYTHQCRHSVSPEAMSAIIALSGIITKASENDNLRDEYSVEYAPPKVMTKPELAKYA